MKKITFLLLAVCMIGNLHAQEIDPDLLEIKERMDKVLRFTAQLELELDISFINMPNKMAELFYEKGKPIEFKSDDFVLIPKRGLDFSLNEIFKHPFITVNREAVTIDGKTYKVINVIPTDKKADFAIATLVLDTINYRIVETEINTKKDGSYTLAMSYDDSDWDLPSKVVVSFEMEHIKIPLNYMGKDAEVDKDELKKDAPKTGKIILSITDYKVVMEPD